MPEVMREAIQEVLEAEMTEALGAAKHERAEGRLGYRSGSYRRMLISRVGKLELRVPQDRLGRFSTEVFERYQRSEKALMTALAEMYVQGVSTRKVKVISEELCGHEFSASAFCGSKRPAQRSSMPTTCRPPVSTNSLRSTRTPASVARLAICRATVGLDPPGVEARTQPKAARCR